MCAEVGPEEERGGTGYVREPTDCDPRLRKDCVASLNHDVDSTVDRRPFDSGGGHAARGSSPATDPLTIVFQGRRVAVCALMGLIAPVAWHVGPAVSPWVTARDVMAAVAATSRRTSSG